MRIKSADDLSQAFGVSRETLERLITYEALLQRWQKTINLVAPATLPDAWHRHFADSAQISALVPEAATTLVDIGSGAGFPGMVLAIMLAERGNIRVTLIESDNRKSAFLREVARQVRVAVDIRIGRIENPATRVNLPAAEVVTSRALAPLPRLFGLAHPLMAAGSLGLFPKGREAAAEISQARETWSFEAELTPSVTDPDARIVQVHDLRPSA